MSFEQVIFSNLINREDYARKVIPFLRPEYFQDQSDKIIFDLFDTYMHKYNRIPTTEVLLIDLENKTGIKEEIYKNTKETINSFDFDPGTELEWLIDKTEKFCQEKAVYNAIMSSIQILDDKDNKDAKQSKGAIPQILSDALAVSFDTHIGHNWYEDAALRFDFYHREEERVPFNLNYFNKITKGGLPKKTLNVILAGVGVGKSLFMCHCAAGNLTDGLNVLYITMEMAEERIAERIDANLLNIAVDELENLTRDLFNNKIEKVGSKHAGRLIIKEYPTSSAGSANFRHLINELKIKKNFIPDIIYIDYLNICNSSRIKYSANVNSYTYIKTIAEELRGLAVEFNLPIISATQLTRSGFSSSDVDMTDTAESFGLPATVDFMVALITSEELQELKQLMVKQLKNRYSDLDKCRRFVIGIDKSKMKLYDVEESAQDNIVDDKPVMDKTKFGERDDKRNKKQSKFNVSNFNDFK
jgi:replicative DNA helicase